MKVIIDAKFYDEPTDETPARSEHIEANSEEEAIELLRQAMKPWEKRADARGFILGESKLDDDKL